MKAFIFTLALIFSFSSYAQEGTDDPIATINAFAAPLKEEGVKGLNKAMEEADLELNKFYVEAAKRAGKEVPSNDAFRNSLRESLQKHGKVLKINTSAPEERLDGSIKRYTVEIEFVDGTTKRVKFQFIKPTLDGKYKLMKSEFLNY